MRVTIAQTLQHYEKKNLPKDICAGIIIMAVSIPISMGYAQIAGLPAVYGLYGSVFPILLFALFSTSPQFIFGVDAAPAALIGGALIDLHIESDSVCGRVASGILSDESGKTRELHICTGDGRFYYRNLHDDYSHAGTETVWRDCGHRRTFGAGRTYRKYTWTDPCSVPYNGCDCTGNSAGGKETDTKISDGGRTDGGWSTYDKVSSGQGVGHTDIKCCADGTSAVEGGGSVCSAA